MGSTTEASSVSFLVTMRWRPRSKDPIPIALAPSIPPDILVQILRDLFEVYTGYKERQFLWNARAVCRRWRKIAFQTQSFG